VSGTDDAGPVNGPLSDLVVIDLTSALAGPHAAMMLADLGARVIKVEPPGGDESRGWGPPWAGSGEQRESTYFFAANRNKESVVADLKSADGLRLLTRLVRHADVLLENFRPGLLDRLGLSVERLQELNPRLVIGSITGFGHDGPEAARSGYDQIAQGESGLMSVTGEEQPMKVGVPISDLLAGMYVAYGVLAALHERRKTGQGRVVRTSLLASSVGVHAYLGTQWTVARQVPEPVGNGHRSIAPYGMFRTADAPIQICCGSESLWRALAPVVGLDPVDVRFTTNADRVAHIPELTVLIEQALAAGPAAYWLTRLREAGVPVGKVRRLDEVYEWEQTRSQGLVIEVDHASAGRLELPGPPLRFDDQAYASREQHLPPPRLGEHTDAVLGWLDEVDAAGDP
jgi:crotonobetainyl-CoA:carnitine CoA-transferase CaiB-like acyl-CoA transferase